MELDTEARTNIDNPALAQRLGITVPALVTLRSRGGDLPPSFKVGRNIRYRLEDVERWEQVEKETARRAALQAAHQ